MTVSYSVRRQRKAFKVQQQMSKDIRNYTRRLAFGDDPVDRDANPTCPTCNGSGEAEGSDRYGPRCETCEGSGLGSAWLPNNERRP